MALVVEDGTGLANADTYVSAEDCEDYAEKHGLTFAVGSPPNVTAEAALRRATVWLDGTYGQRFSGTRLQGRSQARAWPRKDAVDVEGEDIDDDAVPPEVIAACCEAAIREKASPGALSPDLNPGESIKSVQVEGAIAVEYRDVGGGSQLPIATVIDNLLAPLLGSSRGPVLVGTQGRA